MKEVEEEGEESGVALGAREERDDRRVYAREYRGIYEKTIELICKQ